MDSFRAMPTRGAVVNPGWVVKQKQKDVKMGWGLSGKRESWWELAGVREGG